MTTKTISFAVAMACIAIGAHAQTQAPAQPSTKKQVNAKKAKVEPVVEVAPQQPVAPPPPLFSPVHYKEGAKVTDYLGNDAQKVYEWVQSQVSGIPGKPDQFSTSEEKLNYETALREHMASIGQIAVPGMCAKKYDADNQAFEIKTLLSSIKDYGLKSPNPEAIRLRRLALSRVNSVTDKYKAQNAYGASVEVFKTSADEYSLSFPAGSEPSSFVVPGNTRTSITVPYQYTFNFLTLPLKMAPTVARDAEKQIACLYVLELDPPYAFKFRESSTPTRDMPFENLVNGNSLFGKLDKVIVFNKDSGEIYTQAAR